MVEKSLNVFPIVISASALLALPLMNMSSTTIIDLPIFILIGFSAQLIDGAIGMAYGVLSNSILLAMGVSPALSSYSIHTAEIFTTLASGAAHLRLRNVDKKLLKKLVVPGIIGGALGACLLSSAPIYPIKIVVSIYLLIMGLIILIKARRTAARSLLKPHHISLLGGFGGLMDAIGGGGWGPIVAGTLIAGGNNPRLTIGSVNLAEFFVTIIQALTFTAFLKTMAWEIVVGLAIGGLIAAPLAAYICKRLPTRILMMIVGSLIILLGVKNICTTFIESPLF
mgnify:CR=1 FL=1